MQIINFKIQEGIVKEMDGCLKPFNFNNRTEFIREAIREKLNAVRKEKALMLLAKFKGSAKVHVTDEQLHKAREEAFAELQAKFK